MKRAFIPMRIVRAVLTLAACTVAAGCGVLTIDVAVYKGPLVNEPDVQMNQVAVMAMGAKPLLVQFRKDAELQTIDLDKTTYKDDKDSPKSKFIEALRGSKGGATSTYQYLNPSAERANDVLSLYEDRSPDPVVQNLLDQLHDALADYAAAIARFRDKADPARQAIANKLGLNQGLAKTETGLTATDVVRRAIRELLLPEPRKNEWTFSDARIMSALGDDTSRPALPLPQGQSLPTSKSRLDSAERAFGLLADPGFVGALVDRYFQGIGPDDRNVLVAQINGIAHSFAPARSALGRMLVATLRLIERVNTSDGLTHEQREVANAIMADYALKLISTRALGAAVTTVNNTLASNPPPELVTLSSKLAKPLDGPETPSDVRDALRELLTSSDPKLVADTARGLLQAGALVKEGVADPENLPAGKQKSLYGIATGPLAESAESLDPEVLGQGLTVMWTHVGGPLWRGRPDKGLEQLIEDYLKSLETRGSVDPSKYPAKEQLLDALVHFSEKVLFVANNSILLHDAGEEDESRLLQAIGNSIMVQVNELRARATYDGSQRSISRRLSSKFDPKNKAPAVEPGDPPKKATDVYDLMIAHYESARVKALNDGDAEKAERHEVAIKALYEYRARYIYIRPPSFFLKNSYPVTSLQDNDIPGRWRNMLREEALRGLKPWDSCPDGNDKTKSEIDKQFWQNINRVRVAGGGFTNYVIAKDDIGNWYVKNYSADPKDIINAAKQAAMFAVTPAGLAAQGAQGVRDAAGTKPGASSDASNGLPAAAGKFRTRYDSATSKEAEDVAKFGEQLSAVGNDLSGDPGAKPVGGAIKSSVDDLYRVMVAPTLPPLKEPSMPDGSIGAALQAIARFREEVAVLIENAKVTGNNGLENAPAEAKTAARKILNTKLTARLAELVNRRCATLEQYHSALGILGGAPGQ